MASQQEIKRKPFGQAMAEMAGNRPSQLQKEWASPVGRVVQGYVIDPLLGALQGSVRLRDPDMILPYDIGEDAMRANALKTVDTVDRNYKAARVAAGQDIEGVDWLRQAGQTFSPTPFAKIQAGSRIGKAGVSAATDFAQSLLMSPVNTEERSYGQGKLQDGLLSAGIGALKPLAFSGAAKVIAPDISSSTRGLLDAGVPLTPGQTLGGLAQRIENKVASWPVIGAPIRAAQERAVESAYPGLSRIMNQPGHTTGPVDLRPVLPSPEISRGATGLAADLIYSNGAQAALRNAISKRPEAAGLIGDYMRGDAGGVQTLKGLFGR